MLESEKRKKYRIIIDKDKIKNKKNNKIGPKYRKF